MYSAAKFATEAELEILEALTFDDVLLQPAESAILPHDADTRTKLTQNIDQKSFKIPHIYLIISIPISIKGLEMTSFKSRVINTV